MIGCFLRLSRGNIHFCKNSYEIEAKSARGIRSATNCGFRLNLQQDFVESFFARAGRGLSSHGEVTGGDTDLPWLAANASIPRTAMRSVFGSRAPYSGSGSV